MVLWYRNSFLASVVSIFGCVMIMAGIGSFGASPAAAIFCILAGIGLAVWGKSISNDKAFKKWWKQVEEKNLEPVIAKDLNTAIVVYQKNPQERTLKKIAALNPDFAQHIRQNIAAKK